MRSRPANRIHDPVPMVLRIARRPGIPDHFLAKNRLTIDDCACLPVAGAQVKAHPASLQVTAQRRSGLSRCGHALSMGYHYLERPLVHCAHELTVEPALALGRINGLDM